MIAGWSPSKTFKLDMFGHKWHDSHDSSLNSKSENEWIRIAAITFS